MSEHPRIEVASSVHSSLVDVWYLKQILFNARPVKIITQNFNGPCSFIAICNILILRGQIEILPHDRTTVSYEFLSQLVAEYLLTNCPDIDISTALSIMPSTTKGLDLNPQFTDITAFSPASATDAGELDLFARAGIQLVHGWIVDPQSPEADVMTQIGDYDSAVTLIANADYLTKGRLLGGGDEYGGEGVVASGAGGDVGTSEGNAMAGSSRMTGDFRYDADAIETDYDFSDEDRLQIEQAIISQQFLDTTKSQLTYHGLFQLASTLQPGSLVALFRNAHLSVVYKSPGTPRPTPDTHANPSASAPSESTSISTPADVNHSATATLHLDTSHSVHPDPSHAHDPAFTHAHGDAALYALVTDDVFLHEPSIVWERLEDVDGGWSTFCDAEFRRAVPMGGDVAGATRRYEMMGQTGSNVGMGATTMDHSADHALARQLQAEEDERAREVYARRQEMQRRQQEGVGAAVVSSSLTKPKATFGRRQEGKDKERKTKKTKECVIM